MLFTNTHIRSKIKLSFKKKQENYHLLLFNITIIYFDFLLII